MPTVAVIDGIKIEFYFDGHPPPHFHAKYAEYRAVIRIDPLKVIYGGLPKAGAQNHRLGEVENRGTAQGLGDLSRGRKSGDDQMKKLARMTTVEPVIHGVLKIVWNDGYEGVVDLRPTIARGKIFTYLKKPENFRKVALDEYGHAIGWVNDKGEEIDFGADTLRTKAESQARLNEVASTLQY
jgi:hypothetical protein